MPSDDYEDGGNDSEEDPDYGEEEDEDDYYDSEDDETIERKARMAVMDPESLIGYGNRRRPLTGNIDRTKPYILYFDSMNNQTLLLMQPLRSYIEHSYIDRKLAPEHKDFFTEKNFWNGFSYDMMPSYQPHVPRQNNSFDCGLFLLEYAEIFAEDSEFILSNLRQTGVELFKDEWIDMKRDVLKRLIISLATN